MRNAFGKFKLYDSNNNILFEGKNEVNSRLVNGGFKFYNKTYNYDTLIESSSHVYYSQRDEYSSTTQYKEEYWSKGINFDKFINDYFCTVLILKDAPFSENEYTPKLFDKTLKNYLGKPEILYFDRVLFSESYDELVKRQCFYNNYHNKNFQHLTYYKNAPDTLTTNSPWIFLPKNSIETYTKELTIDKTPNSNNEVKVTLKVTLKTVFVNNTDSYITTKNVVNLISDNSDGFKNQDHRSVFEISYTNTNKEEYVYVYGHENNIVTIGDMDITLGPKEEYNLEYDLYFDFYISLNPYTVSYVLSDDLKKYFKQDRLNFSYYFVLLDDDKLPDNEKNKVIGYQRIINISTSEYSAESEINLNLDEEEFEEVKNNLLSKRLKFDFNKFNKKTTYKDYKFFNRFDDNNGKFLKNDEDETRYYLGNYYYYLPTYNNIRYICPVQYYSIDSKKIIAKTKKNIFITNCNNPFTKPSWFNWFIFQENNLEFVSEELREEFTKRYSIYNFRYTVMPLPLSIFHDKNNSDSLLYEESRIKITL